jgi:hypothetical protein
LSPLQAAEEDEETTIRSSLLSGGEEEETTVRSSLLRKRRPSDRLFQETMKRSDRLRLALQAAAGEEATGTQREQAQAGGGFRHGGYL